MIVYQRKKRTFFIYWALFNVLLIFIIGLSVSLGHRLPTASYLLGINLVLIVLQASRNSLKSISIIPEQSAVTIETNRWFFIIDTYKCELSELEVLIEKESAGRFGKRDVFKLFIDNELLVSISSVFSGWDWQTLTKIVEDVNEKKKEVSN
ncbi:hypothetical protein [Chitinophaga tropicalis]|uniref:Uncharacterized protein n=1 Tax=Chitinophaga tropicalis TaxID=2683588 RepID=A0A7K1U233_9BACT|nr:hypothetical protein [Chitinophaga tropicalis]MVT08398.1 hypothetical protein [Chitinophaga tropicalis]